jgi:hypothetical protein
MWTTRKSVIAFAAFGLPATTADVALAQNKRTTNEQIMQELQSLKTKLQELDAMKARINELE